MSNISIQELAIQAVDTMIAEGYKPITAWYQYENNLAQIVMLHEEQGVTALNECIVSQYAQRARERYEGGEISYSHLRFLVNSSERFIEYAQTGSWFKRILGKKSNLTEYFESVLNTIQSDLQQGTNWGETTLKRYLGTIRQHITWLINEGHKDFYSVDAQTIRVYLMQCAQRFSSYALVSTRNCLKKLYFCLFNSGFSGDSFENVFLFRITVEKKILAAVESDEVAATLSVIDRKSFIGKRDYAIILLGAVTGMRSSDIAELKLTDIDWRKGEIKIVQKKTNTFLTLPLTKDVGEALRDYILNGRILPVYQPIDNDDRLFLTVLGPRRGVSGRTVASIYKNHRIRAGFQDNTGFHSLRRMVGSDMVIAGVPVETISQVLGHRDMNSAKQYISLDSVHLKECAIDFSGIEPEGGEGQ